MRAFPPLTPNAWLRFGPIRRALASVPRGATVLEVGPGQGAMGARLATRYRYLGVESDPLAGELARARVEHVGGRVVVGDSMVETRGELFDVVCAFEVLEHLEDDHEALASWRSRLAAGGRIVLSVPSGPARMGPWDHAVGHYRRYDRVMLESALTRAGFGAVRIDSYGVPLGYLLEWIRNRLAARAAEREAESPEARTAGSGRSLQPRAFGALIWLLVLPFRLVQRPFARTRFGTGLVATATVHADG